MRFDRLKRRVSSRCSEARPRWRSAEASWLEVLMHVQLLFGISVAFGFVAWAVVTALYIWPELQARSRIEAL
jgi:hypothetical protein